MNKALYTPVQEAKRAALDVLLHNTRGPYHGLPRTAGWGYPEPYTRDLMISSLGILASGNERLIGDLRRVLETLGRNQSRRGHIPSLVHDSEDRGDLSGNLPPCLFPYIRPEDPDWRPRYEKYNLPGEYHNGGIWPFICGFYIVAVLSAGFPKLAEKKLMALTETVRAAQKPGLAFGFNEWIKAQDGTPRGQDWQTWSAAMYLYAAICVERGEVLFFDKKYITEELKS